MILKATVMSELINTWGKLYNFLKIFKQNLAGYESRRSLQGMTVVS